MLVHEKIAEYCRDFKLSGILEHYAALAEEAADKQLSYTDTIFAIFLNTKRKDAGSGAERRRFAWRDFP